MSIKDEITKAVGAHGLWKSRLSQAINTGASEFDPAKVCRDDQCDFGKWIYGTTLTADDKKNPLYATVKKLHATFHTIAADVLRLALGGTKDEAQKLMEVTGRYGQASTELTQAMMKWRNSASG